MVRELEREKEKKRELINPIFDLDGTVIKEKIGLFKWTNPEAILGLRPEHLTELGVRIKNSGKQFDILTARGSDEKEFIKQALQNIGMNIRRVIAVGTKNKVLNKNRRTVRKKLGATLATFPRTLHDADAVPLEEAAQLVNCLFSFVG